MNNHLDIGQHHRFTIPFFASTGVMRTRTGLPGGSTPK